MKKSCRHVMWYLAYWVQVSCSLIIEADGRERSSLSDQSSVAQRKGDGEYGMVIRVVGMS